MVFVKRLLLAAAVLGAVCGPAKAVVATPDVTLTYTLDSKEPAALMNAALVLTTMAR
jgi:hypothetical protein